MTAAERRWSIAILLAYATVVAATLPFHEPWRDEAQSWMLVKSLGMGGLLRQMGYEGTPALWHLLQFPLARLGLPYASLGILNAVIAIASIAVLCFFSPFRPWQKAAVAFSYIMLYEYGVIARCYSLIVLCLFVVAALYPRRRARPVAYGLALLALANINVQSLGVACLMTLIFLFECWRGRAAEARGWAGVSVAGVGIALAVLQLRPPPDLLNGGLFPNWWPLSTLTLPHGAFLQTTYVPARIGIALSALALAVILWDARRNLVSLALIAAVYVGWCYLFVFKLYYEAQIRHTGLFAIALVFILWLARGDEQASPDDARFRWSRESTGKPRLWRSELITFGALCLSITHGAKFCVAEFAHLYSGAHEAADFIAEQDPGIELAAYRSGSGVGLLPYLPGRQIWSVEVGKRVSYSTYTRQWRERDELSDPEIVRRALAAGGAKRPWLVLTRPLRDPVALGYEPVFASSELAIAYDETFFIYAPR